MSKKVTASANSAPGHGSPKVFTESPKVAPTSQGRALLDLRREFLDELQGANRAASTVWWYEVRLEFFEREMGLTWLSDITRPTFNNYLLRLRAGNLPDSRKKNLSDAYVANHWRAITSFLKWCRRRGYQVDPGLFESDGYRERMAIKQPEVDEKETPRFSADEVEGLRAAATAKGARDALLIELLLQTGIRLSEAAAITLDDFQGPNLRIRKSKKRKMRWPPLPSSLRRQVAAYVAGRDPSGDQHLFLRSDGKPLSWRGIESVLDRIHRMAGVEGLTHKYRHTFAYEWLRRNPGQIEKLREIMGHEDFKTLRRYATFKKEDLAANVDLENPFARPDPPLRVI